MAKYRLMRALARVTGLCLAAAVMTSTALAQAAPKYKYDPTWPKPLPHKWKLGGVTGLAVDKDDNVWVLDRPNDLRDLELHAETNPPTADCCVHPPSMIHFNKEGDVIGSFDPPQGHGMAVDNEGFVYIGQDTVRKYDPTTGKLVGEVPRAPDHQPGGFRDTPQQRVPGKGSAGPGGTYPVQPRTRPDPAEVAAFHAKYPPTTPMIVGNIEEIRIDDAAKEIYCADSYLGGRIMVFDMDTFKFKRGWGAYGHTLDQISTNDADRAYTPGGPEPKEFRQHLTLNFSKDGLVYAADRRANRIQVFTKQGKYIKEFVLAPYTADASSLGDGGSTGGVAFSPDPGQRLLYISDITNNHVWFLNREDGKVLGTLGQMGQDGGEFFGLHMIATDSKGNIYTGEVFNGERVQRFVPEQ